jgi:hypothetical protein
VLKKIIRPSLAAVAIFGVIAAVIVVLYRYQDRFYVRDKRIPLEMCPSSNVQTGAVEVIDGGGRTLMPGLIDAMIREVDRGYLLLAHMLQCFAESDFQRAHDAAAEAIEIGERFADRDLVAMGVMDQGHALLELGRTQDGLRLMDESMVAVTSGELSPIVAGILYCNNIAICRDVHEVRRAREWTTALTVWCERHPDMVAHTGVCLVHRAEIMQLHGAWQDAMEEAQRACERLSHPPGPPGVVGMAFYQLAELHRLRGEAAEAAFEAWSGKTPRQRSEVLHAVADAIEADMPELSRLECENVGKPVSIVEFEMDLTLDNWRFFASAGRFWRLGAGDRSGRSTRCEPGMGRHDRRVQGSEWDGRHR